VSSRELLALLVVAAPALAAAASVVAPRRAVHAVAIVGAVMSAAAAGALATVALASPGSPLVEPWVVVDAAAEARPSRMSWTVLVSGGGRRPSA